MNVDFLKNGVSYIRYYSLHLVENTLLYGGKLAGRLIFPFMLIWRFNPGKETYWPEYKLKSKVRIFFEHLWYILKTGEINKNYYYFGFDVKGKKSLKNYVPWLSFTNARNRKNQLPSKPSYDTYNFVCLLRDKFVFEGFCKGVGICTPSNIGMINGGRLYLKVQKYFIDLDDIINIDIDAFLKRNVSYGGGMGYDVMPLRVENKEIFIDGRKVSIDDFKKIIGSDNWVIQECIKNQHHEIKKIHPQSINTVRIITVNTGSSVEVLNAVFRMGRNGRYADNYSSGGINVDINLERGTLKKWALSNPKLAERYDRHPNTGVVFEDFEIPFWKEVVESVKNAHSLFYGIHSIGWDVCITDYGPLFIEGNDNWDTVDCQEFRWKYKQYFKN